MQWRNECTIVLMYIFSRTSLFQLAERVGRQLPPSMLDGLRSDITKVADTLRFKLSIIVPKLSWSFKLIQKNIQQDEQCSLNRSEVSLLVPNRAGSAEPEVAEAAKWLLSDGDLGFGLLIIIN